MAINIPNQLPTGLAPMLAGSKTVADLMQQIRQHQMERQRLQEAVRQHAENMGFNKEKFNQEMGFKNKQEGRRQQAFDQKQALMNWVMQNMPGQQGQSPASMPSEQQQNTDRAGNGEMNAPGTGILQGEHEVDMNGHPVESDVQQQQPPEQQGMQQNAQPSPEWLAKYQLATGHPYPQVKPYESPANKEASAIRVTKSGINERDRIAQEKENRKITQTIEDTSKPLLTAAHHISEIEKILKQNPGSTGVLASGFSNMPLLRKMTNETAIKGIDAHSVPLQGKIAHDLAARSGYGVLQFAQSAKPSGNKSDEANWALVKANKDMIWESFNQMKTDYERHNPDKKFPYKLPASFYEKIITPNGKKIEMDPDQAEWALANGGKRA